MSKKTYWIQIFDGKNNNVASIHVHAKNNGEFDEPAVYRIRSSDSPGTWHAHALHGHTVEVSCSFEVKPSAIPEFPAVVAGISVAGICAFIYFRMKKGREALAAA